MWTAGGCCCCCCQKAGGVGAGAAQLAGAGAGAGCQQERVQCSRFRRGDLPSWDHTPPPSDLLLYQVNIQTPTVLPPFRMQVVEPKIAKLRESEAELRVATRERQAAEEELSVVQASATHAPVVAWAAAGRGWHGACQPQHLTGEGRAEAWEGSKGRIRRHLADLGLADGHAPPILLLRAVQARLDEMQGQFDAAMAHKQVGWRGVVVWECGRAAGSSGVRAAPSPPQQQAELGAGPSQTRPAIVVPLLFSVNSLHRLTCGAESLLLLTLWSCEPSHASWVGTCGTCP